MPRPVAVSKFIDFFLRRRRIGLLREDIGGFFDENWYLQQYEDVRNSAVDAFQHYCRHGWREGRWPNPIFDPAWYRSQYADVAALDGDPLLHFVKHGRFEGRRPSAQFNPQHYGLRHHPELAQTKTDASEHYLSSRGASEEPRLSELGGLSAIQGARNLDRRDLIRIARDLRRHLRKLDQRAARWRDALLIKRVYEVDEECRPVPDGLSLRYLVLATDMRHRAEKRSEPRADNDSLVELGERLIQDEIARAQQLERQLLERISRPSRRIRT